MGATIRVAIQRFRSRTFLTAFILVLIGEGVTILSAWLLLERNVNQWMRAQGARLVTISQQAASATDWSRIDAVPHGRPSALFERYEQEINALSKRYFLRNDGEVYVAVVDHGEEYGIYPRDSTPMDDQGKTDQPERTAYATRKTAYTPSPVSNDNGTYLAAYTPLLRNGKVIGVIAAVHDSATQADFEDIVSKSFWYSIVPVLGVSLLLASALAWRLVEPAQLVREVEESAKSRRALSLEDAEADPWNELTEREQQVADLAGQGLKTKAIATQLFMSPDNVKKRLQSVYRKMGCDRRGLIVRYLARPRATSPP